MQTFEFHIGCMENVPTRKKARPQGLHAAGRSGELVIWRTTDLHQRRTGLVPISLGGKEKPSRSFTSRRASSGVRPSCREPACERDHPQERTSRSPFTFIQSDEVGKDHPFALTPSAAPARGPRSSSERGPTLSVGRLRARGRAIAPLGRRRALSLGAGELETHGRC